MKAKKSEEHIEYIKEKIADFRHFEDIGLAGIAIGVAVLSSLDGGIGPQIGGIILLIFGFGFFIVGGHHKSEQEKILREKLRT